MYNVSQAFLTAIENESAQHIRGTLTDMSGTEYDITDELMSDIHTESQCVDNADEFCIGGMYVGSLSCTLNMDADEDTLTGGTISLEFGAEISTSSTEWIPLGEWNITKAFKESSGLISITAKDNLNRLLSAESDGTSVRILTAERIMQHVTDITGVEFAQTVEDLEELTGITSLHAFVYIAKNPSVWAEVKSLAQLMGCCVVANREGRIEFRRLGIRSAITVSADKRKNIRLEHYTFSIKSVGLITGDGFRYKRSVNPSGRVELNFSGNIFVPDRNNGDNEEYTTYIPMLNNIVPMLWDVSYVPGEIQYYGNPAIDVADCINVTGGIAGNTAVRFLVGSNVWQFRGVQTLTSPGTSGSTGSSSGSSGGSSSASGVMQTINLTKSIEYIQLDSLDGMITNELRTVSSCGLSCRGATSCFLELNLSVSSMLACIVNVRIYVDGILQTLRPSFSLDADTKSFEHLSLALKLSEGIHSISISASGSGSITTDGYIWGQSITASTAESTDGSDYLYTVRSSNTKVDKYIGSSTYPSVPSKLGGKPVTVIGSEAFMGSDITAVYIPSGLEEIE